MLRKSILLLLATAAILIISTWANMASGKVDKALVATLNGLQIVIDGNTGGILKMSYPGVGTILESKPHQAGIIDLAYPIKVFEVLRLASRYSQGTLVTVYPDSVVIFWDKLGSSRANFTVEGKV